MRARGRVHWRLFAAGLRESSTYRLAALFGGLVANAAVMSSYVWLSQGLLGSVNLFGRTDLADRIRSGDVAVDFLRPLSVQASACLREIGRGVFALLPRGLPSVAVGAFLVGIALPPGLVGYILGALSVLLAITVSATTVYLVGSAGSGSSRPGASRCSTW